MDYSSFLLTVVAVAIGFYTPLGIILFMVYQNSQLNQFLASFVSPSSSASPSCAPTPMSPNAKYQAFPSFHGNDVRRSFLSHLMKELKRKAIGIFIDSEMERGEFISPELKKAIRGSRIAIVILSRNYASSSWCLDELVEIMECRRKLGQTVITLFYKVDPTAVRNQTGEFGQEFGKACKGYSKEEIRRWKQALAEAAEIAGYHISNQDDEAAMVEIITNNISNKLSNSTSSSDFDGFVGMEDHMKKLEPMLQVDSNDVRIIGIWGPPGIGKTSFARYLYSKHSHAFPSSVFMKDIKGCTRPFSDEYALKEDLQQQFLSQILHQKDIEVPHLGVVQDRLGDKKVLVVLDDVDELEQLDALAKENQWFGPGSRIIITTRNKKLLKAHGIDYIHKLDIPTRDQAFQIFCKKAFGQDFPEDGFEELAWDSVFLEGIHPSGIRAMGSFFRGMSEKEWRKEMSKPERKDALKRLRTNPDTHNPLKNSELGVEIRMTTQKLLWSTVSVLKKIQMAPAKAEAGSDDLMIKAKRMILSHALSVMKKIHMSGVEDEAAKIYESCKKAIDGSTM